jgi:hypothetical protein
MAAADNKARIKELRGHIKELQKNLRALEPDHLSMRRYENWLLPGIALVLAFMGIYCARSAFCVAFLADLFIVIFLAEVACRPGLNTNAWFALPHRFYSIFMAGFLIVAIVCSFAHLYLQSGGVYNAGGEKLTNAADAVYFSVVTLTTLGYGDYVPRTHARWLVIWELGSGLLLLLLIVPVLASRLALLGEGHAEP